MICTQLCQAKTITVSVKRTRVSLCSKFLLTRCNVNVSLEPLEKLLVRLSVSRRSRNKMAPGMNEDLRVVEGREKLPAHAVRDHFVLQPKHVQGRDLEGSRVERFVFLTGAAETSDKNGKAEVEVRLQFLLLKRAQHGHESCSLTEAQDAVKWTLSRDSFSHGRHALFEAEALLTLLLSVEALSLDVRKPPAPWVLVPSWSRSILLVWNIFKNKRNVHL